MATLPTSGTDIRFISGVPFSISYDKTRWFETHDAQEAYFLAKPEVYRMTNANFQRTENSEYISVSKPIEQLYDANYVMFKNASHGNKWFYGFVTHLEYKNRTCTYVHIRLDVLQTWMFRLNFKPSFIVREHCKLWNEDGSPVVNTVDEGLNYGLEYDIVEAERFRPFGMIQFMVVVCKTPMDDDAIENVLRPQYIGSPQTLTMYVIPFDIRKKPVSIYEEGTTTYTGMQDPIEALQRFYKNDDAVNNIVSIYITPNVGRNFKFVDPNPTVASAPSYLEYTSFPFKVVKIGDTSDAVYAMRVENQLVFQTNRQRVMDDKYSGFRTVKESKLLMYPYTNLVVDDFKGNRNAYKLEYILDPFISALSKGSIGLNNYHSITIDGYNSDEMSVDPITEFTSNDHAIIDNQPNDVSVINDYLSAFIQGNRNQLENQTDAIQFNGIMNGARNVANIVTPTNPLDMISDKVNAGFDLVQGAGNMVLEIQGMEARQADIANVPPSIGKMGSNTAYNAGNNYGCFYFIKKQIKPEYIRKLTDFFNAFGYKVNEIKMPNLHTRRYWNYVQTKGINIQADMNFADLHEIKQIFDNGITLWHTNDIGNYDLENEVL